MLTKIPTDLLELDMLGKEISSPHRLTKGEQEINNKHMIYCVYTGNIAQHIKIIKVMKILISDEGTKCQVTLSKSSA